METIKNNQDKDNLYKLIMEAGEILLHNGAEIFRVEETMIRISEAYGAHADVFAISNGIFMTLNVDGKVYSTQVKEIPISTIHLERIVQVNKLSRDIVKGTYTIEEAIMELEEIKKLPYGNNFIRILFAGLGSATFSVLFGGGFFDSLAAFIAGSINYTFIIYANRRSYPKVLKIVIGSCIATLISSILFHIGLGNNLDHIIIGAIITLVPGVALTTSIRDFFDEDYISGTIHLVDAILVAISLSVGVITVLQIWNIFF